MTESQHWGQAGRLPSSHPVAGCAQSGTQAILAQSVVSRVQIGKISKTRLGKAQKFLHCLLIFHSRVLLYIWTLNTDGQIRTHLVGSRAASSAHLFIFGCVTSQSCCPLLSRKAMRTGVPSALGHPLWSPCQAEIDQSYGPEEGLTTYIHSSSQAMLLGHMTSWKCPSHRNMSNTSHC